jgi:hypothetical protein
MLIVTKEIRVVHFIMIRYISSIKLSELRSGRQIPHLVNPAYNKWTNSLIIYVAIITMETTISNGG